MVHCIADNIISCLGFNSQENFDALKTGKTGISMINDHDLYHQEFPAARIDADRLEQLTAKIMAKEQYTLLEQLMILSISEALEQTDIDISDNQTAIILSTTKGNIDLLEKKYKGQFKDRDQLWKMGEVIGTYFNNPNVIVLSNACISGVVAIQTARMMIESGQYKHMVVCGGDILTKFVVSGFMSFLSLSPKACKPFDSKRDGLSLGEAAGTIILSSEPSSSKNISIIGGASANDANHISGPSRTGEGSYIAISKALQEARIDSSQINHISAHGTATPYNDEMESIAIERHQMEKVAVNSLKGFWGHTLGAAGVIETIALIWEMKHGLILPTAGFNELGVSKAIRVSNALEEHNIQYGLKMASGFGGCNAALVLFNEDNQSL